MMSELGSEGRLKDSGGRVGMNMPRCQEHAFEDLMVAPVARVGD